MPTEQRKFKVSSHVILLLSLFVALSAPAQERQRTKVKAAPLEIKLSTPTPILCAGTSLLLEMEIKNISRKEVKLDKIDLWNVFSYSTSKPDGSGSGGGQASGCDHCRGNPIFFHPGMTYWDSHNFPLQRDFFQSVGDYSISVSINSVSSNNVNFKLIDCGTKPTEVTK
jgi:hypothetical protein